MAITAGAIQRYNNHNTTTTTNTTTTPIQMRALIPVAFARPSIESKDHSRALRNYWAFISCGFPMNTDSSIARLKACNKLMTSIKTSYVAPIQMWIQSNILPLLPQFLQRKTAYDIFSRHSIVFSNVPGPPHTIHFCGEKILGIQVIFPNLIPQCLIVSYANEIFMNMVIDCHVIKDCDILLPRFYMEEAIALGKEYGIVKQEGDVSAGKSKQGIFSIIA